MPAGKKETVIICSAHSDDFVIGAGGTIAKYAQEGIKVIAIVFSYGEKSHPWLQKKVIQKIRTAETFEASDILHCKAIFFDMKDMEIYEDYKKKNLQSQLLAIFRKEKPSKIFTHSSEDHHSDHRAVNKITLELVEQLPFTPEIYLYSVWNPVSFETDFPALFVDITKTFSRKMKALMTFRSQMLNAIYPLLFLIIYRAIMSGLKMRKRFAESFYRIR